MKHWMSLTTKQLLNWSTDIFCVQSIVFCVEKKLNEWKGVGKNFKENFEFSGKNLGRRDSLRTDLIPRFFRISESSVKTLKFRRLFRIVPHTLWIHASVRYPVRKNFHLKKSSKVPTKSVIISHQKQNKSKLSLIILTIQ